MMEIARTSRVSTAPAVRFFERWCDLPTHPEWAPSMEYFVLDGEFGVGATGRSKPVGGTEAPFTVTAVGPGYVYADTTRLPGARLTVHHTAEEVDGATVVTLLGSLDGPAELALAVEIAPGLQDALERDLASLAELLERDPDAVPTSD